MQLFSETELLDNIVQIKGKSHQFPVPVGILVSSRTDSSRVSQMVLPTVGVTAFRAWGFLVKV